MKYSENAKRIIQENPGKSELDLHGRIQHETGEWISLGTIREYRESLARDAKKGPPTVGKRPESVYPKLSDPRLAAVEDVARLQYVDSEEVEGMAGGSYLVFAEMAGTRNKRVQIMPDMVTAGFFVNPQEAHRVAMLALEQRECVRVRILKVKEIAPSFLKREKGPGGKLVDETLLCSCSKQILLRHGCRCGGR